MGRKVVLAILDGYGISESKEHNATYTAKTPNLDKLFKTYPHSKLICSGKEVGLPDGTMGNSEVGHLNIGAGRVIYQDISRIDNSVEDGSFKNIPSLVELIDDLKAKGKNLHIMGLLSDGGVHSSMVHLKEIINSCKYHNFENITLHPFMDGRDTPPMSGINFIKEMEDFIAGSNIKFGSISGRFYAMDRDNRWERIEKAYNSLVNGEGEQFSSAIEAVESSYKKDIGDEFILPSVIVNDGKISTISEGDGVIFINFRADRAREISIALNDSSFDKFETKDLNLNYLTMTRYRDDFPYKNLFPKLSYSNILGEVVGEQGCKQLRISETEKYAHVTFFFNGGEDKQFKGEDRVLIDSPKVETYDLKPEMSSVEITDRFVTELERDFYDLVVINYPNCDMVGHTGVFDAAVKAVESVDNSISRVIEACEKNGYTLIVTADHGNAEKMFEDGVPFTAHTKNLVPFLIVDDQLTPKDGKLGDIAPTILSLMGLETPKEMDGIPLI